MSTQSPPSPSASSRPSQTAYKTCTASLQPSSSYDDATPRSSTSARRITDLAYPTPSSSSASARHPGCVLCSIVAQASSTMAPQELSPSAQDLSPSASPLPSPNPDTAFFNPYAIARYPQPVPTGADGGKTTVTGREILYQDAEITVYPARGKERLCSGGRHLIVVLNRHLESVYDFGPADVPLLSLILETSHRLLKLPSSSPSGSSTDVERDSGGQSGDLRVGFVGSVTKDPQSPHRHLHAHAMLGPVDTSLPGSSFWRRNVVFGSMNWWSIEDLRAEIRESTSNNRVKSGYTDRHRSPIDRVPDAGSLSGLPNALDPDPYRDNLNPQKPAPPTKTHAAESSAMARGSSSSSSRTETSLGVAYQRAATVSEESLAGGSDTYDELDEESSSGVLRK